MKSGDKMYIEVIVLAFILLIRKSIAVGCYKCDSTNGSNPGCKDPFNPAFSPYEHRCMNAMEDRKGYFPAQFCIKMKGRSLSRGIDLLVRTCTMKSMGHQCGVFNFADELYSGCLTTCKMDACNRAAPTTTSERGTVSAVTLAVITTFYTTCFVS